MFTKQKKKNISCLQKKRERDQIGWKNLDFEANKYNKVVLDK